MALSKAILLIVLFALTLASGKQRLCTYKYKHDGVKIKLRMECADLAIFLLSRLETPRLAEPKLMAQPQIAKLTPQELKKILCSNLGAEQIPQELKKIFGSELRAELTPQELKKILCSNLEAELTPQELEKILDSELRAELTPSELKTIPQPNLGAESTPQELKLKSIIQQKIQP